MSRKLEVEIIGDSRSYERALGSASRAGDGFASSLGKVAKGAAIAAGAAGLGALYVTMRSGFKEVMESQKVMAQTEAVIKSTGGVAKVTAKQVEGLAQAQSRLTGIDDELVQTGANLLLTFKKVRNEVGAGNQVFDRATKAALDLSTAGFGSVESASKMLGKALNDPIRGMTAMSRAGVTFTEQQRNTIRSLVESGKELQAQKLILREVESQVGGSAKAFGQTLPGQLQRAKIAFEDVSGEIVASLLPAITKALEGFLSLVQWVQANLPQIKATFSEVFGPIVSVVTGAFNAITTSSRGASTPLQQFGQAARAAIMGFRDAMQAAAPVIRSIFESLRKIVVEVIIPLWQRLLEVGRAAWEGIAKVFRQNGPEIQRILERTGELIRVLGTIMIFLIEKIVVPILKPMFSTVIPAALTVTIKTLDLVTGAVETVINIIRRLLGFAGAAFEKVKKEAQGPLAAVAGYIQSVASAVDYLIGRIEELIDRVGDFLSAIGKIAGAVGKVGGAIGGAVGSVLPGRQHGGPVRAGQPYVVGEAGPELFVPRQSGEIVPSGGATRAAGGGGQITVNVGGSVISERDLMDAIYTGLLQKQRRIGSLGFA